MRWHGVAVTEGACVTFGLCQPYCNALSLSRLRRQLPPGGSLWMRSCIFRGIGFARSPRCLQRCNTKAKLAIKGEVIMIFQLGRYTIDVDVEKTKAFYASAVASNEVCACDCCQHFPDSIISCSTIIVDFLNNLGVDPQKPGEVFGGKYHCSGWYHIVGTLLNGRVTEANLDVSNAFVPDEAVNFQVWFDDDNKRMGWIENNFPSPILEMSFSAYFSKPTNI